MYIVAVWPHEKLTLPDCMSFESIANALQHKNQPFICKQFNLFYYRHFNGLLNVLWNIIGMEHAQLDWVVKKYSTVKSHANKSFKKNIIDRWEFLWQKEKRIDKTFENLPKIVGSKCVCLVQTTHSLWPVSHKFSIDKENGFVTFDLCGKIDTDHDSTWTIAQFLQCVWDKRCQGIHSSNR